MLHDAGIFVSAVNPLLIREYGNNSLRKVKTDKADSLKIARYGLGNWTELREHTSMDTIRYQLKTANRQYGLYTKNKTAFKNNLIALLDQTYPGVNALFDSPVRAEMNRLAQQMPEYQTVMGLYGVGESLGPQLMTEIGDVRRFGGLFVLLIFPLLVFLLLLLTFYLQT